MTPDDRTTPADAPAGEAPPSPLERWKRRYDLVSDIFTPKRLALALAIVVLALGGLLGGRGLVEAAEDHAPTAAVDDVVPAAPYEVSVLRVRHAVENRPMLLPTKGYRYVWVVATVTNTSTKPVDYEALGEVLTLDAEGLAYVESRREPGTRLYEKPARYRTSDGLLASSLQPGLSQDVAFVWKQELASPPPEQVTVTVHRQVWRQSMVDGSWGWARPEPAAEVTLPVTAAGG